MVNRRSQICRPSCKMNVKKKKMKKSGRRKNDYANWHRHRTHRHRTHRTHRPRPNATNLILNQGSGPFLLNHLFGCWFLSILNESISVRDLSRRGCCMNRNNRIALIADSLHLFFAAISLGRCVCICEKWDEAMGWCAWLCECALHFERVRAEFHPIFDRFQFHSCRLLQFEPRRMITRADI